MLLFCCSWQGRTLRLNCFGVLYDNNIYISAIFSLKIFIWDLFASNGLILYEKFWVNVNLLRAVLNALFITKRQECEWSAVRSWLTFSTFSMLENDGVGGVFIQHYPLYVDITGIIDMLYIVFALFFVIRIIKLTDKVW